MTTFLKKEGDKNNHKFQKNSSIMNKYKNQKKSPYGGIEIKFLENIRFLLNSNNKSILHESLQNLHVADIADLLERLNYEERYRILFFLKKTLDASVIQYITDDIKDDIVKILGPKVVAEGVSELKSDDAVNLIEDLNRDEQKVILRNISYKNRALIKETLAYPEDSAGRLMQKEVVCVPLNFTIVQTIKYIQLISHKLPEEFYNVYVLNKKYQPVGIIGLNALLQHSEKKNIQDIMKENFYTISATLDQEEVSQLFQHYDLISAPVTDINGRIMGCITLDDIVDVIKEEAEEDILRLSRVSESDFYADALVTFYRRSPWLMVTLINVVITTFIIEQFRGSIEALTEITFFLPIAAMMGGNSGLQVVTVIIRALTTHELRQENIFKSISKEIFVGLINGMFFSILVGGFIYLIQKNIWLGVIVGGSLACNMIWASLMGCIIPIIINKSGYDPAIGAGPTITIMTDVAGYTIYLVFATIFLL